MQPTLYESDHATVDRDHRLRWNGVDLGRLAREYPTPFFLLSERILEENYRRLTGSLAGVGARTYYSVKTNFESAVLQTWRRLGAGAEISGELDLHVALRAGFDPADIVFDGPCKTDHELELAVRHGVALINVESVDEIRRLDALGRGVGRVLDIGVRLDPMNRRPYYDRMITTYKQKFGFPLARAREAFETIRTCPFVRLAGLHAHIGSQILAPQLYVEALTAMLRVAADLKAGGVTIDELNLGGGFPAQSMRNLRLPRRMAGARILERLGRLEKRTPGIEEFGRTVAGCWREQTRALGLAPRLAIEPGRSLVNNACVLVGRVRLLKANWVFTDISINEVPENLFFTEWRVLFPERMGQPPVAKANLSGPTLSTYDVLGFQKEVPALAVGDAIAIFDTGGYSIPRANQFTRPRSAVHFLDSLGGLRTIRRRETVEDVVRAQIWETPAAAAAPAEESLTAASAMR
jgi:diaminopimelate decarboxylase